MKHDGISNRGSEILVENRRLVFDQGIPPTKFAPRIPVARFERANHEIVIVGREINRQRQIRQQRMRLIRRVEIRRDRAIKLLENFFLGKCRVELNGEKLRHLNEIGWVVPRVFVLSRPVRRDFRAEWKGGEARACTQKWNTTLVGDSFEQDRPGVVFEGFGHLEFYNLTASIPGGLALFLDSGNTWGTRKRYRSEIHLSTSIKLSSSIQSGGSTKCSDNPKDKS